MHFANSMPFIFRLTFISLLSFLVLSCATMNKGDGNYTKGGQPGDVLYNYVKSNASDRSTVDNLLANYSGPKRLAPIVKKYEEEIARLYTQQILSPTSSISEDEKKARFANITINQVSALFALYPIDTAKWMKIISTYSGLNKNDIYESAITAGLDPSIVFAASASGFEDTATPLINSIGLVIYGQDEESTAKVKFRAQDDTHWREGLDLAWEPIYGSFAGSIVYLEADTTYQIEVTITDAYGDIVEHSLLTTTKPNTPPIDPNKIYYLSEIYSGGQLDLEALNIEGSADGYAKIIGDGPIIEAGSDVLAAVNIGNNAYIMLENLTVKGGQRYGILAQNTHNIWIKGCDISKYGRIANVFKGGKGYTSEASASPINYDSGIYLEKTGTSVIEECEIHEPNGYANHWGNGHPNGPNALQVYAYHEDSRYEGQIIVRNNRFYGVASHRFNDVIEGRKNFFRTGGFVRNSAIYGNYLAYANDDLIEIDGGQQNVLVYDNELEQGYAGISIAPNMLGPSYIFHNYIHDLGDERGREWTAIKAGGLISKPGGKTYIIENHINTNRNGIAASRVNSDSTFWLDVRNNVIINRMKNNMVGLQVYDKEKYGKSTFTNNIFYNSKVNEPNIDVSIDSVIAHPMNYDIDYIESLSSSNMTKLIVNKKFMVPNFSRILDDTAEDSLVTNILEAPMTEKPIKLEKRKLSKFSNQARYGKIDVEGSDKVTLTGNVWYKHPIDFQVTQDSVLSFDITVEGDVEIAGIGLETNNSLTQDRVFKLAGSQIYGNNLSSLMEGENSARVQLTLGQYDLGELKYIVFILDNDNANKSEQSRVSIGSLTIQNSSRSGMYSSSPSRVIQIGRRH